jgi:hypothetical protein
MTQLQLVGAGARATGETVKTIQRRGFSAMSLRRPRSLRRHRSRLRPSVQLDSGEPL